jgi:hypothetical protein
LPTIKTQFLRVRLRVSARTENEMRIFLAILIALAVVYFCDAEYNQGNFVDGIQSMGRAISHSVGFWYQP